MQIIVLKASHLKHVEICIESDNQYITVFPIKIDGQMIHWIADKHISLQNKEKLY